MKALQIKPDSGLKTYSPRLQVSLTLKQKTMPN